MSDKPTPEEERAALLRAARVRAGEHLRQLEQQSSESSKNLANKARRKRRKGNVMTDQTWMQQDNDGDDLSGKSIPEIIGDAYQAGELRRRAAQLLEFEAEAGRLASNNAPRYSGQMKQLRAKYLSLGYDPEALDARITKAYANRSAR